MTKEQLYRMQIGDYVIANYGGIEELAMIVEIGEDGWCKARIASGTDLDDCINDIQPIKIGEMTSVGLRLGVIAVCVGKDPVVCKDGISSTSSSRMVTAQCTELTYSHTSIRYSISCVSTDGGMKHNSVRK